MKKFLGLLCFLICIGLFANIYEVTAQCYNVALGKPATASNYAVWAGAIPGGAVDGDCNNAWNAGTYAPQYWQVDLLSTYTINNINVMFSMYPNGNVFHQILTSPDMISWTAVDTMVGYYYTNQLIERCYSSAPLTNVRGVRVNTLVSPSWVSIEEMGVYTLSTQAQPSITSNGGLSFCQGDSVVLTSSFASTYLWNNGATSQSIKVGSSGTYTVITNPVPLCVQGSLPCTSCGFGTASVTVVVNPKPVVHLGNDTALTQGSSLQLNAGNPGSSYLWSTGANTQQINVNISGNYWVKVTNSSGCFSSDTINISFNNCTINQLPLNLQQGLVAYYPFCGNANDLTTNNLNGIVHGSTFLTTDRFNNANSAYYFSGTSNGSDWIEVINNPLLNLGPSFTVSVWVYREAGSARQIIVKGQDIASGTWLIGGETLPYVAISGLGTSNPVALNNNQWYMLTGVLNGITNKLKLYQNGIFVNEVNANLFTANNTYSMAIGRHLTYMPPSYTESFPYPFKGKIDDIGIWSRALSSCEIYQLYSGSLANNPIVNLGNDTILAQGGTLQLYAGNAGSSYLWSTNDTTQTINVSTAGTYWVKVSNIGGCYSTDTIHVDITTSTITFPMTDTTICKGESVVLAAQCCSQNICSKSQLPINLQQGLVAFYPFCGNANDESGNGNNGTVNGASLTTDRFGNANSAYFFNGNKASINSASNINITGIQARTIAAWIKWNTNINSISPDVLVITEWGMPCSNHDYNCIAIRAFTGATVFHSHFSDIYNLNTLDTINWHLIVFTFDGSIGKIYHDGILSATGPLNLTSTATPLKIGYDNNPTSETCWGNNEQWNTAFFGKIDDVIIYNRFLSANEVLQLYTLGTTSTASSYYWSTGDTTQTITVSPSVTTNYNVSVSNGSISCADTSTVYVSSPQINLGNDTTICQGQSIVLQASQLFSSYLWSTASTSQSINVNTQGMYWLKATNASGCSGYDTINITVNPIPLIQLSPTNPSICIGDTVTLNASSNIAGTSYNWSNGGNGNSIKVSPAITSTYTIIGTKNSCTDTVTVSLIVNPIPIVSISPSNPSICKGDIIVVTASSNLPSTTYIWSNSVSTTTINLSPSITSSFFVVGSLNQCKDTAFTTITVKPLPIITTIADKNPVCEGESIHLTAFSNLPSTTYLWNNNVSGNTVAVNPIITSYYYVTGSTGNCHDTAGITIIVIPQQTIDLGKDNYLCIGDEIKLNAGNLIGSFLWSDNSNSNSITITEPGTYWVSVDDNGCMASDTIVFKPCSEIFVPNVFTPNGDGINDIFKANIKEIDKLQLFIYNRWGKIIFETQDINVGWDGRYLGGDADAGVYYWVIRFVENRTSNQHFEKEIHGSVSLMR